MLTRFKIPKTIYWVSHLLLIFLVIFTAFRLATFFAFKPNDLSFVDLLPSFILGIRYDLRWIAVMLLPIIALSLWHKLSPFYSRTTKKWWTWYLALITFIAVVFFIADFGSFSYNATRLDAGAMNFAEDFKISLQMMWQTYPMIWLLIGLVVVIVFFRWMYQRSHWRVINRTDGKKIPYSRKAFAIATLLLCCIIYGKIGMEPLLWKDCFRFRDSFKSYLSLNPLENFYSTLKLRKPEYNEVKARSAFEIMAEWMPLSDKNTFSYYRHINPTTDSLQRKPNIVLVMCESFSMYKSTMSGNPLNTTPYFDSLSRQGLFFEKCFTPHFSTARGLFAIITGIPDAQLFKFSTRNPLASRQHTIINNFEGYTKHYFLGGNPDFNNFKGLLKNINELQMHVEGNFSSPKVNVWGISDKDLFLEANQIFRKEINPFFAIIQTSFNHRPYMIPPADTVAFKSINISKNELEKYGFESVEEYNTFRYSDYCFQKFIEAAQKENYFDNTIFVFIGDHGVAGNATAIYPAVWTEQRLTDEHVPFLIYASKLVSAQKRSEVVSQIDILPTIAGMVKIPYTNSTLGRDLLDSNTRRNFAFITNATGKIGVVTNDFYYTQNLNFPDEGLFPIHDFNISLTTEQQDSVKKQLSAFTNAFFETARYLIMNNRRN